MKAIFTILFLSIFFNLSAQQDWDLFPLQQRSYIQVGEELLLHYNDSTEYLSDEKRLHHFGQQYYDLPFDSCQYEFLTNDEFWDIPLSQRPFKDTLYSNPSFFYKKINQQTLPFYHKKPVGFTWFLPTAFGDSIKMTIIENEEIEALHEYVDSVKTYQVEVWSNGAVIGHALNTMQFRLAKNLGLLEWINLEDLYFLNGDVERRELFGFEKEDGKYGFTASFSDYIHPEVGEIYKYERFYWPSSHPHYVYERDSITAVWEDEEALYTTVNRDVLTIMNQENTFEYGLKDTVVYHKSLENYFKQTPNFPLFDYVEDDGVFAYFGYGFKKLEVVNNQVFDKFGTYGDYFMDLENCWADIPEGAYYFNLKYYTRSGFYSRNEATFFVINEGGNHRTLIGHQTADGTIFGDIGILTTAKNIQFQTAKMSIYPNPTLDECQISVEGLDFYQEGKIVFYNHLGQVVLEQNVDFGSTAEVNGSSFSSGVYFAHLLVEGQTVAVKKVVKF